MRNLIIFLLISFIVTSCFKDDVMVPKHEVGEVVRDTIEMTVNYDYQVYYSLYDSNKVATIERKIFDLNFECLDTSTVIRLNSANFALIAETEFKTFDKVTDTVGLVWHFDKSDGDVDSLAIKNWININGEDTTYSDKVWVLNRGLNPLGVPLGLMKIKFNSYKNNSYYFSYCNMDGSGLVETYVSKDPYYSYTQFSMSNGGEQLQTEPELGKWDLLFTQYTTLLYTSEGLAYPYIVNGVIQSNTSKIAIDSTMNFVDISLGDTINFNFSRSWDKIGYEWKIIQGDVEQGNYSYVPVIGRNYIIRDASSYYYKLRFLGFYNENGVKGYPSFEYARL